MALFKARFSTFFNGSFEGLPDIEDCSGVKMFFEAQNIKCARDIAYAMLGEEFYELEKLYRVLNVDLVRRRTPKHSTLKKNSIWWSAFRNLVKLDKKVKIIINQEEDVIGIQFQ